MTVKTWRKIVRREDGAFLGNGGVWVANVVDAKLYDNDSAKELRLIRPEIRDGTAIIIDVQVTFDFDTYFL